MPDTTCVIVGDKAIGKMSMVLSYATERYLTEYNPNEYKNQSLSVTIYEDTLPNADAYFHVLQLDILNQPIYYDITPNVFVICFSVVNPKSFQNIQDMWLPDLNSLFEKIPFLIVGTQIDLRNDRNTLLSLAMNNEKPISKKEGKKLAKQLKAFKYVECSAMTLEGISSVFNETKLAAWQAMQQQHVPKKEKRCVIS